MIQEVKNKKNSVERLKDTAEEILQNIKKDKELKNRKCKKIGGLSRGSYI